MDAIEELYELLINDEFALEYRLMSPSSENRCKLSFNSQAPDLPCTAIMRILMAANQKRIWMVKNIPLKSGYIYIGIEILKIKKFWAAAISFCYLSVWFKNIKEY